MMKEKMQKYKLKRLKIGKPKWVGEKQYIDEISWDVHWQTNDYLTAIIRDYLRFFIQNTMAIGIPAEEQEPNDLDKAEILWREMVNSVADKFDEVADLSTERGEAYRAKVDEAFDALKEIFYDLSW